MKKAGILLFLFVVGSVVHAGVVYGTLTKDGRPVTAVAVTIDCGSCRGNCPGTTTDEQGSYSVRVAEEGRCKLILSYQGQNVSGRVYSQPKPARHDFAIVRDADGNWTLRAQ